MGTKYFTKDHEYIDVTDGVGTVGITDYAQGQLGDIVFVELPESGASFSSGDDMAVVESVKAASDVYAPISGEITETNADIEASPDLVNQKAESDAWFVKIKLSASDELSELMDEEAYKAFVASLD